MKKIPIVAALALTLAPSTARRVAVYTVHRRCLWWPCARSVTLGGSLGWMGDGILGVEADLGFNLNNNLFNTEDRTCWVSIGTFSMPMSRHSWAT